MKTQSDTTNKSASVATHKSSHAIDEPKATTGEELEGSNRPRLSRRACALLSWAAVAIMLAFIFCMSAKTATTSITTRASSRSSKTSWLRRHGALRPRDRRIARGAFHGIPAAWRRAHKRAALHAVDHIREQRDRAPRRHARRLPRPAHRAHLLKPLWHKRRVPPDFYPQPKLRPYGLACRHLRRSHWGRYRMDAFEEAWFTPSIARPETEAC